MMFTLDQAGWQIKEKEKIQAHTEPETYCKYVHMLFLLPFLLFGLHSKCLEIKIKSHNKNISNALEFV